MKKYKAVIYDIDGTVLNTLNMNMYPLMKIIKEELNEDWTFEEVLKFAAYPGMKVMEELNIKDKEKTYARWVQYVNEYEEGATLYEGFEEIFSKSEEETKPQAPVERKTDNNFKKNLPQKKDNNRDISPRESRENRPRNNKNRDNQNLPATSKSTQPAAMKGSGSSVFDIIRQHGFETINGVMFKGNLIDFVCVAKNQIVLCLIDKEPGDWLADEERFNDEEPLWFSESSHRISPVRKVDIARRVLSETLDEQGMRFNVGAFVVVSIGNIINAEDMFDVWNDLKVNVTRIDRGTPKEIKLFAKTLPDAVDPIGREDFEKIKKIVRNLA